MPCHVVPALQDDWSGASLPDREGGLHVEYAEGRKPNDLMHPCLAGFDADTDRYCIAWGRCSVVGNLWAGGGGGT